MAEDKKMARGSAQELFRDNIGSVVDVGVQTLFAENIADMGIVLDPALSAHDLDAASSPARVADARATAEAIENHHGIISGSREGVRSGVAERVVDARDSKSAVSEREDQRANETMFYLALIQNGEFVHFMVERAFENMSDEDVRSFIDDVESATGMSFEDAMVDLLGPDYVKRDGESDEDYARRVGPDAARHVVEYDRDAERFVARPGFENHALTPFLIDIAARELSDPAVQTAIEMHRDGRDGSEIIAALDAGGTMDGGWVGEQAALTLEQNFNTQASPEAEDVLVAMADDRDVGRESNLDAEEDASQSADFLGSLGLS